MKYKMRKQYQRALNKRIRELNKGIEKDNLWKGRFVFLQMRTSWYEFDDRSGGELRVYIRAYDKKTKYYKDYILDFAPWMHGFNWHLAMDVANKFIVEDADVWREDPRPSVKDAIDYTAVPVDIEKLRTGEFNWYISNEHFDKNGYVRM